MTAVDGSNYVRFHSYNDRLRTMFLNVDKTECNDDIIREIPNISGPFDNMTKYQNNSHRSLN